MHLSHHKTYLQCIYIIFLLGLWQVLSTILNTPDLPSIDKVYSALQVHYQNGELLHNLGITLYRVLLSFSLAMLLGVFMGVIMAQRHHLNILSDTLLVVLLNIPALVTIMLAYIWFGLIEAAAIIAVVLNKLPNVIVSIREGARVVDPKLTEMAQVYCLCRWTYYRYIYLPQIYPYILLAARNGLSLIWKIVLVVELLGRSDGVGFALHSLFQFFDIAGILAYTFCFIGIVFSIEVILFKPFEKLIQRGRKHV
jgi:NitT/TauT family transport system permease protein